MQKKRVSQKKMQEIGSLNILQLLLEKEIASEYGVSFLACISE
jgi:hypothetical protein